MKFSIFLSIYIVFSVVAAAQQTEISGTVVDQQTGEPLVGATVKHITSGVEVITDFDGNFSISGTKDGPHQFTISYVSYHEATLNRVIVKQGEEISLTIKMRRTKNNSNARPALTLRTNSNGIS